jgi:hydroxymethylpyrimidine pyrophosphatase-like HAD family hydrolase
MMLAHSGQGLIMENAPLALKNKLSHLKVIESNQEDGVAKHLYHQLLNTK